MIWTLDDPWEDGYAHALEYYKEHGDLAPTGSYVCRDGFRLGKWLKTQRSQYNQSVRYVIITEEQIRRLEAIGMVWNLNDELWLKNYRFAKDFYEQHGHLNVPREHKNKINFDLNDWFHQQREAYRKNTLSDERRQLLNEINFDWLKPTERLWETHYASARTYFAANGHLAIPVTYRDKAGLWLGRWVVSQRKNKAKLTESQVQRLNDIGMEW
ncbi:MAG: helicase associated domain-containing protein [Clostridia bacterium]|nr:helicase associated domain-containing protein [Clostridia bacterium]